MDVEVLKEAAGEPRRERDIRIHRAGNLECAGRSAYDVQHPGSPVYHRVDDSLLPDNQVLCRHPGCFKGERPGTTIGHLRRRRPST